MTQSAEDGEDGRTGTGERKRERELERETETRQVVVLSAVSGTLSALLARIARTRTHTHSPPSTRAELETVAAVVGLIHPN